ncbi:glycosyltransferase family 2 protein [Streptomyces scabiei]|uniref:glycosyltransferase family 2 protein n=1 Tax=Streptomyces scabiei TaxID=1930 RepID=UPI00131D4301|nr:glycosyltransferase family 2 protein [Streptomyces scabiei]
MSIIVATARDTGCLRLVQAVREQFAASPETSYEIVLVLDGCPRYSWLSDSHDDIRTLVLPQRLGIARARNIGIDASRGQLLAFLDDDCVPAESWLPELLRMSTDHRDRTAFGGRVIGTDPLNLYGQLRDGVYYYETFGAWYTADSSSADVMGAPYVNGGNCAYRREALLGSGGFDALLPAYSDVELGRRLALHERAVLSPRMAIHHDHPGDFRQYMIRCWRSGRARAVLWRYRDYRQDSPFAVSRAIAANLMWNNAVHRRRRITASPVRVVAVLTCQEIVHGIGYAHALLGSITGRRGSRSRAGDPTGVGVAPGTP